MVKAVILKYTIIHNNPHHVIARYEAISMLYRVDKKDVITKN